MGTKIRPLPGRSRNDIIQVFKLIYLSGYPAREIYVKAVPGCSQGRFLRFDKFVGLTYNILNKTADKEGQDFPLRRLNVSK